MKNWPIYFKERLCLVNPKEGFIGIATCWTPKEKIALSMPDKVAVVGQLYTKGGIEYIIRNLWANPRVSCLVVCGQDSTKSGKALVEFFGKKADDEQPLFFDEKISPKALEIIRKKVRLVDLRGKSDPREIAKEIAKLRHRPPFAKRARTFPQAEIPECFPSETSVFRIEAPTIGFAWLQILRVVLKFGWEIPRILVYGNKEKGVLNLTTVITEENMSKPKLYRFLNFDKKELRAYFKEFFNSERGEQAYTYGERLLDYFGIDQVKIMVKKLREFSYNKGAVAILWQPTIDNFPKRKPWHTPCLTLIQGICQKEKLHLTAYFRSNDVFGAWPLNAFALRKLQTVLAEKIKKQVGLLTIISQSAFIDDHDLGAARKVVAENERVFCQWDPRGNFIISIEDKEIVAKHFSPSGKFLQEFRVSGKKPKAAIKMIEKLLAAQAISRIDHAFDLGAELQKAELAIKLGILYKQDRPLQLKKKLTG